MGETVDDEIEYVKATKVLDGMAVEDRDEYVNGVLTALGEAIKKVIETKGKLKQLREWERFNKEMQQQADNARKGEEIMICALYAVKKRYRPLFVELLRVATGIKETVKTEG